MQVIDFHMKSSLTTNRIFSVECLLVPDPVSRNPHSPLWLLGDLPCLNTIVVHNPPSEFWRVPEGEFYRSIRPFRVARIVAFYTSPYSHEH